jgi:hypothetical protein
MALLGGEVIDVQLELILMISLSRAREHRGLTCSSGLVGLVGAAASDDVAGFFLVNGVGGFGATLEVWRSARPPMLLLPAPGELPGHQQQKSEILQY